MSLYFIENFINCTFLLKNKLKYLYFEKKHDKAKEAC